MAVKNPTKWTPPSGTGYVTQVGLNNFITNLGAFLIDNLGNFIVTNTTQVTGKSIDVWTKTAKGTQSWVNKSVTVGSVNNIADASSNLLVDSSGNDVSDSGESLSGKNVTVWTASGV